MSTTESSTAASKSRPASTRAGSLAEDPRILQARKLILEAVEDHRSQINGIRDPDPQLADALALRSSWPAPRPDLQRNESWPEQTTLPAITKCGRFRGNRRNGVAATRKSAGWPIR